MGLLSEINQEIEYQQNFISILELFIIDSDFFAQNCHLYNISQVTKLFLISHKRDLTVFYNGVLDYSAKKEKCINAVQKFITAYETLTKIGFTFYDILKLNYTEYYTLYSVIDDIHHKKYLWRKFVTNKKKEQIVADLPNNKLYFLKNENAFSLVCDFDHFISISIPDWLYKYVDSYIKSSKSISTKNMIIIRVEEQQKKSKKKKKELQLAKAQKLNESPHCEKQKVTTKSKAEENTDYLLQDKPIIATEVKQDYQINHNDFIIRCVIFKCTFKQHNIIDINASIDIMNISSNSINSIIIPAGYCANCNRYFIMESTYKNIFRKGLPLCKIVDEKLYKEGSAAHLENKWGSPESVLKQYGYSVSEIDNLPTSRRQKILAIIIDIEVLKKVEIIGYLRYFIRIHQSDRRFDRAISKWNEDIEFVSEYNKGHYTTYKVSGLKKSW